MENSLQEAALRYAQQGRKVIPLKPGTKEPIFPWKKNASADPETIREWWEEWPEANIGIVTGEGLVVVDVDEPGVVYDPSTLQAKTPRGSHYYYRGQSPNRRFKGKNIDVQGEGGYIVAAPSRIGDKTYQWVDENMPMKPFQKVASHQKTVIVDLDNTISDTGHRNKHLQKSNPDWETFNLESKRDKPNKGVIKEIQKLKNKGHRIVILSGRDSKVSGDTKKWLKEHGVPYDKIKMRPSGSTEKSDSLKRKWLQEENKDNIVAAFDDDDKNVRMFKKEGIRAFKVNRGQIMGDTNTIDNKYLEKAAQRGYYNQRRRRSRQPVMYMNPTNVKDTKKRMRNAEIAGVGTGIAATGAGAGLGSLAGRSKKLRAAGAAAGAVGGLLGGAYGGEQVSGKLKERAMKKAVNRSKQNRNVYMR